MRLHTLQLQGSERTAGKMQKERTQMRMWPQAQHGRVATGAARERTDGRANAATGAAREQANGWVDAAAGTQASGWQGGCDHRRGMGANGGADAASQSRCKWMACRFGLRRQRQRTAG